MGERKGQNKYYPPDFDPKKHGSLAGYHGQHPLRERARKMHLGILIIRFEMPYNIWCDGCNNPVGMGVRYNAEKSKIGMYYTTPIYKFRMKCHLCDNHYEIKTDPAAHDYVIITGARRKEQRWDPKDNEQVVPEDRETHKKLERDAMYKLEHGVVDKDKSKTAMPGITQIERAKAQWRDDYDLNGLARNKFRTEKVSLTAAADRDKALLQKSSLDISLVKEHEDDVHMAELLKYTTVQSFDDKQKQKREEIARRSLFGPTKHHELSSTSDHSSSTSGSSSSSCNSKGHADDKPPMSDARRKLGEAVVKGGNLFGSPPTSTHKTRAETQRELGILRKSGGDRREMAMQIEAKEAECSAMRACDDCDGAGSSLVAHASGESSPEHCADHAWRVHVSDNVDLQCSPTVSATLPPNNSVAGPLVAMYASSSSSAEDD